MSKHASSCHSMLWGQDDLLGACVQRYAWSLRLQGLFCSILRARRVLRPLLFEVLRKKTAASIVLPGASGSLSRGLGFRV